MDEDQPPGFVHVTGAPPSAAGLSIRPGIAGDLDLLVRFEYACFPHAEDRFSRRRLRSLLANRRAPVLIAESSSHAVGCGIGLIRQHTSGVSSRIYSVAVLPEARGLGAGRRVAEALLSEFSRAGARRTYLEVRVENTAAIALYVSLGFRQVCELPNYYAPGHHGLSFCRPLDLSDAVVSAMTPFDAREALARTHPSSLGGEGGRVSEAG